MVISSHYVTQLCTQKFSEGKGKFVNAFDELRKRRSDRRFAIERPKNSTPKLWNA